MKEAELNVPRDDVAVSGRLECFHGQGTIVRLVDIFGTQLNLYCSTLATLLCEVGARNARPRTPCIARIGIEHGSLASAEY